MAKKPCQIRTADRSTWVLAVLGRATIGPAEFLVVPVSKVADFGSSGERYIQYIVGKYPIPFFPYFFPSYPPFKIM